MMNKLNKGTKHKMRKIKEVFSLLPYPQGIVANLVLMQGMCLAN